MSHWFKYILLAFGDVDEGLIGESDSVGDGCNDDLAAYDKVEYLYGGVMTQNSNYLKEHE